ncbi:hypothetical protein IAT38_000794 [Cryptococcus sp. DSM 104549]
MPEIAHPPLPQAGPSSAAPIPLAPAAHQLNGEQDASNPIDGRGEARPLEAGDEERAAVSIQRVWRGHAARKQVRQMHMESDARWDDLVKQSGDLAYARGQLDNQNDVKSRWKRAAQAASRLQTGDGLPTPTAALNHPSTSPSVVQETIPEELPDKAKKARRATFWGSLSMGIGKERDEGEVLPFQSKALEQQHWLEMIDPKHRYGSNMKYYFRKWKEAETSDNFFRWLDRGEGKGLDLEEMPRERFERERITYLSAEQRLNYLVKVDKAGLLRWARNNELVDTAAGKWKDAGDGQGIIPDEGDSDSDEDGEGHKEPPPLPRDPYATTSRTPWRRHGHLHRPSTSHSTSTSSLSSDSYSAQSSDLDENEDTHYVGLDKPEQGWWAQRRKKVTPGGMRKELLRKTVRRNTWIYVSDMKLNLFVGIKKSGTFQHSSFLAGGKVTSAGIIVVKQGLIKSLNPLSGHYRSSIENFRSFIGQLEGKGVDLSHVKIAKSVLSLWGLSKYSHFTKAQQNLLTHIQRALHLSHAPTEEEKSEQVRQNAEREEAEHQERMRRVWEAEREAKERKEGVRRVREGERRGEEGVGEEEEEEARREEEEEMRKVRREVLYGRKREDEERKEDTKKELRPV